jgi:hypothetical protein
MQKTSKNHSPNSKNSMKQIFQHLDLRYVYTTGCRLQQITKTQVTIMMIIRLYSKKIAVSVVAATLVNFVIVGIPIYVERERGGGGVKCHGQRCTRRSAPSSNPFKRKIHSLL